jgi:hypothetical protein
MTSSLLLQVGFPLKEDDITAFNSSHELTLGVFLNAVIKWNLTTRKSIIPDEANQNANN